MTATLLLPAEVEEGLTRLRTTDSAQLRRAAAALETTARVADMVSAGLDGVTAHAQATWHGAAADAFADYESSLRSRLSEVCTGLVRIARGPALPRRGHRRRTGRRGMGPRPRRGPAAAGAGIDRRHPGRRTSNDAPTR